MSTLVVYMKYVERAVAKRKCMEGWCMVAISALGKFGFCTINFILLILLGKGYWISGIMEGISNWKCAMGAKR